MNALTTPPDPRRELQTLLASRLAFIVVESREESRVLSPVREISLKVQQGRGWGVFQWTVTEGLQRTLADPEQLLKHLKATPMPVSDRQQHPASLSHSSARNTRL